MTRDRLRRRDASPAAPARPLERGEGKPAPDAPGDGQNASSAALAATGADAGGKAKPAREADCAFMLRQAERVRARPRAPKLKLRPPAGAGPLVADFDAADRTLAHNVLLAACGTIEPAFADWLVAHVVNATRAGKAEVDAATVNGALAAMHGAGPRDELEAMLVAQMVAVHAAAMDQLRCARSETYLAAREAAGNLAVKLFRTYAAQLEALKRHRGGGEQRMVVEHVHVHPGGQAVVGPVTAGGGTGGRE